MKESTTDFDLSIDLETELEEYTPQFIAEERIPDDEPLEIHYDAPVSTHIPTLLQSHPEVALELEEPVMLPEEDDTTDETSSTLASMQTGDQRVDEHQASSVDFTRTERDIQTVVFYSSHELKEKKQRAIMGALLAGGTSALFWAGFQFASLGLLPRALVVFVGCFAAAGSGLGQLKEDQSQRLVFYCGMLTVLFALLAWAYFGYSAMQQLQLAQQHELLSYYGIKAKPQDISLLGFMITSLRPLDLIIIPCGGFVAVKSNRAARW